MTACLTNGAQISKRAKWDLFNDHGTSYNQWSYIIEAQVTLINNHLELTMSSTEPLVMFMNLAPDIKMKISDIRGRQLQAKGTAEQKNRFDTRKAQPWSSRAR
jgi:hypothetical protein